MSAGISTIADFNTADIESVEVLKDADLRVIDGSKRVQRCYPGND